MSRMGERTARWQEIRVVVSRETPPPPQSARQQSTVCFPRMRSAELYLSLSPLPRWLVNLAGVRVHGRNRRSWTAATLRHTLRFPMPHDGMCYPTPSSSEHLPRTIKIIPRIRVSFTVDQLINLSHNGNIFITSFNLLIVLRKRTRLFDWPFSLFQPFASFINA